MEASPVHFIFNKWQFGSGAVFHSHNSATGDIIWSGNSAKEFEVNQAVESARTAFEGWAYLPLEKRVAYLEAFCNQLNQAKELLAQVISKETGKPLWDSKGEVNSMINKAAISIDAFHKRCAELIREQPPALSVTRHKPHGLVAVFGPFNFPGHLPNGHIIPALLAGNTVVFKPSELTPLTAELTIKCWEKTGLPRGVINLIQGGKETGKLLSQHNGIDGLFFTGSWQTGKIFREQFSDHPEKILALEMGGNNPLIVMNVTEKRSAALLTIQSAFLSSGQRCTCARRLIIPQDDEGDAFLQELIEMTQKIKVGTYTDTPEPFMGPVINEVAAEKILEAQSFLKSKGGIPIIEMKHLKKGTGLLSPGIMDVSPVQDRPDEEIFGPFLQVIRVLDFDEAIREANDTAYGLSAGLISDREDLYKEFYKKIRSGVVNWNMPLTGASSFAPFGGIGRSGNHRPSAYYAADYCSYPVASLEAKELKMPNSLPPGIS